MIHRATIPNCNQRYRGDELILVSYPSNDTDHCFCNLDFSNPVDNAEVLRIVYSVLSLDYKKQWVVPVEYFNGA